MILVVLFLSLFYIACGFRIHRTGKQIVSLGNFVNSFQNKKLYAIKNAPNGDPRCKVCQGKAGMNCPTCSGSGIDKINGNIFERWTCTKCKGFGYVPCTSCNKNSRGLTPEQTGER